MNAITKMDQNSKEENPRFENSLKELFENLEYNIKECDEKNTSENIKRKPKENNSQVF